MLTEREDMKVTFGIAYIAFLLAKFSLAHDVAACRYVTIPVCGEESTSTELNPVENRGPPGKSGPRGYPGSKGTQGLKGEKGESPQADVIAELIDRKLAEFESRAESKRATDVCEEKNRSGIYSLYGDIFSCDGQGWTIIQHRQDGLINFERTWQEYSNGFGSLDGEFWLGLRTIHKLTRGRNCKLRVELQSFEGEEAYAEYRTFSVADEGKKFQLSLSDYSGTAGDSMTFHDGMYFTTKDNDNDKHGSNCSPNLGGWWYNNCFRASPNAVWGRSSGRWTKIIWFAWKGESESLSMTTMKIRCP